MPAHTPAMLHTLFQEAANNCDVEALMTMYEAGAAVHGRSRNRSGAAAT